MLRRNKFVLPVLLALGAFALIIGQQSSADAQGSDARAGGLVVLLEGTAEGVTRIIDGIEMVCFDVDLVDPATGRVIGRGSDCLDLNSIVGNPMVGGFAITTTTFFHLPNGSIKSRNRATVQPVLEGSPGLTHLTGDVAQEPNILEGTGRYRGADGTVRLNGAIDLSRLFTENIVTLSCVFRIDLYDD